MRIAIIGIITFIVCYLVLNLLYALEKPIKKLRIALVLRRMGKLADKAQRIVIELGIGEVNVDDKDGTSEAENIEEENS